MRRPASPLGLLGRILLILLLAMAVEFGASTFLYERAERFTVRDDEARRLAEHLVITRKLLSERPRPERGRLARELTTDRYEVSWSPTAPPAPVAAPELDHTRDEILAWEPALAETGLRLRLGLPGRRPAIAGELRLPAGDWLLFRTRTLARAWELAIGRIALGLIPALTVLLLGSILIRRQLDPLRGLARATKRVGLGRAEPLREAGTSEVRQLIRAFNAMEHRIHDLIADRTQALAAVGHDLRTPLARVQLRAETIGEEATRDAIARDVGEMAAMLASLLAFLAGEDDPEAPAAIDVAVLAATVVDDASDRGGDASYDGLSHLEARVRPVALRRAITNLVENALHYAGSVCVRVLRADEGCRICVEDRGPGIPPDRLEEVLRPFARLDAARARNTQGLGLGLAIVARTVEREGGRLVLANRDGGGLRVEIVLPTAA